MKKAWEESLKQVCMFAASKDLEFSGTNLFSQLSGHSNNVGQLYVTHGDADEGELGSRNICPTESCKSPCY